MDPLREKCINGCHLVREYYWAGEYPVYLDSVLQEGRTFDQVCREVEERSRPVAPNPLVSGGGTPSA